MCLLLPGCAVHLENDDKRNRDGGCIILLVIVSSSSSTLNALEQPTLNNLIYRPYKRATNQLVEPDLRLSNEL